ncbi:hypothetical protein EJ06DRAFT_468438 [Trichodelitschia bisporula]|uniref:CWH43-like N-terminal domain-containing protein n=1 Tax=Trichodelitschia bisporula TaxID=703511 RepID=A0A6G1IB37_9PEZI|nr:hypothetical protein EJ06DRAFT_468438 [Trichodelitschia bisporula]
MWGISYWAVPIFSALVWLAMLLAMLLFWITKGKPIYPSMAEGQRIAYISDVGTTELKPLFIAMGTVSVVTLDLAFIAERWLRHRGRLAPNTSMTQKALSGASIICSIGGAAGLILLTIFDTLHHHRLHDVFLCVFIIGYVLSAIFICIEYQRLGRAFDRSKIIRISFWIKLFFILAEIALAIAFGVANKTKHYNTGAILEWVIALVYTFYVLSFFVDFIPAVRTKHHQSVETAESAAVRHASGQSGTEPLAMNTSMGHHSQPAAAYYGNGHAEAYGNGHTSAEYGNGHHSANYGNGHTSANYGNGYANGYGNGYSKQGNGVVPAQNF